MENTKAIAAFPNVKDGETFTGVMRVFEPDKPAEEIYGDWLYRPDTDCWYCKEQTYPAEYCAIVS